MYYKVLQHYELVFILRVCATEAAGKSGDGASCSTCTVVIVIVVIVVVLTLAESLH